MPPNLPWVTLLLHCYNRAASAGLMPKRSRLRGSGGSRCPLPLSVFLNHRTQKLDKTMWSVFLDQRNSTRIAGNLSRFGGQRGIGFPRRGAGMAGSGAPGAHHPAPGAEDAISHLPDGMAVADERLLRQ